MMEVIKVMTSDKPSIEAVALTKRYGKFQALSDLNLKVEGGGKCVGLLGPNGAGKTTALKIFSDMITQYGGKAIVNGFDIRVNKKEALSSCGVVIETPEIYPSLTIRESLSMFAELRGIAAKDRPGAIERAISQVRMNEWADRRIGEFSRGMKQRTNIAAALLANPQILILDEPTTGLDPGGMAEIKQILKSLKHTSRLILMSSHLLNEVSEICDEVAMIHKGRLIVYDKTQNIESRVLRGTATYLAEFARQVNISEVSQILRSVDGVQDIMSVKSNAINITASAELSLRECIVSALADSKFGLVGFKFASLPLEETYLNLITEER
jgi:ABC-2 type transport system ATP-binding protein